MSDGDKQAELHKQIVSDLASLKARQLWLLTPTFLMVAGIFGMAIFSVVNLVDIQNRVRGTDHAVLELRRVVDKIAVACPTKTHFMPNGLTDTERTEFYHLAEGSEVFPLDWLRALERKETGRLFLEDTVSIGFIPDPGNADGLPVGLTAAETRGLEPLGKMVGLNCAACHVGEMTYNGTRLRIDGAPNFLDTRTFFASLIESSFATLEDSDKLLAFIARLKQERADQKGAKPEVRTAARRIIDALANKGEKALADAIAPAIKKIIEDEQNNSEPLDLGALVAQTGQDAAKFRAKLLEKFDNSSVKGILDKTGLKDRLAAIAKDVDQESMINHTLEEVYIGVRLLKARAAFLKKLGAVGSDPRTIWGPGRVDAFGSARAFLFEDGYKPINPVSYPFIWGLKRVDWFHYDNNTTTFLQRNFGQALGVGAVYDPKTLASSLHPRNLYRLEELATKINPPDWPEDILGKIDRDAAQRGAALYKTHKCAACHDPIKNEPLFRNFELDKIGTDPGRAIMFAETLPKSDKYPDGIAFSKAIGDAMNAVMLKSYEDNNVTKEERDKFSRAPFDGSKVIEAKWRGPKSYASRPLNGVWASGPFLHNGSVPTIDDLLKPAKDRPSTFYVGNREFDPVKLGYISTPPQGAKNNYDTKMDGNRNVGHEFGTTMTDAERKDLLEYLKSI